MPWLDQKPCSGTFGMIRSTQTPIWHHAPCRLVYRGCPRTNQLEAIFFATKTKQKKNLCGNCNLSSEKEREKGEKKDARFQAMWGKSSSEGFLGDI